MRLRLVLGLTLMLATNRALAATVTGADKSIDDPTRCDVSQTQLTQPFLVSMERATRAEVVKAMGAPGVRRATEQSIYYIGTYSHGERGGTGDVGFKFGKDERVATINALLDGLGQTTLEFIWIANVGGCSDFAGSQDRCNP